MLAPLRICAAWLAADRSLVAGCAGMGPSQEGVQLLRHVEEIQWRVAHLSLPSGSIAGFLAQSHHFVA